METGPASEGRTTPGVLRPVGGLGRATRPREHRFPNNSAKLERRSSVFSDVGVPQREAQGVLLKNSWTEDQLDPSLAQRRHKLVAMRPIRRLDSADDAHHRHVGAGEGPVMGDVLDARAGRSDEAG
jgi:hypothetical protein